MMKNTKKTIDSSKIDVPDFMKEHKELVGICVGRCIFTKKWAKGRRIKDKNDDYIKDKNGEYLRELPHAAHAHTSGPGKGFICFSSMKELNKETTCKHELSHIITGEGHTKKWAEKYVELGTPKWLTVEWLQKKYGFDDNGGEGEKVSKDWLKKLGIDEKDIKK